MDQSTHHSRRSILAAALAGSAASVAHALGQPRAARAANGDPVIVGASHTGTTETAIGVTGADVVAIRGTSPVGRAIVGVGGSGVWGETAQQDGLGVYALNTNSGAGATGLYAHSDNGWGVQGHTLTGVGVSGYGETGIAGEGGATGVSGHSSGGTGVLGVGAIGVHAIGGLGFVALQVTGRAVFDLSGTINIAKGKDRATSEDGLPIHPGSVVMAVIQTGDGKAWVRKVKPTNGMFTVFLNKPASTATRIAWIAFG